MNNLETSKIYDHDELKEIGKKFLKSIGCKNIQFEQCIKEQYIHDVVGYKNDEPFVVECGVLDPIRLLTFMGFYKNRFFWLPYYNAKKIYLFP